ncbi:MAG: ABC-3 protein, partial [Parcubacteria group bacterium GW2011_GWB1_43_6]
VLMVSLVIIPAAASKNISVSLSRYTANSAILGGLSAFAGIWIANYFNLLAGPIVVLTGGVVFLVTLLFKK